MLLGLKLHGALWAIMVLLYGHPPGLVVQAWVQQHNLCLAAMLWQFRLYGSHTHEVDELCSLPDAEVHGAALQTQPICSGHSIHPVMAVVGLRLVVCKFAG